MIVSLALMIFQVHKRLAVLKAAQHGHTQQFTIVMKNCLAGSVDINFLVCDFRATSRIVTAAVCEIKKARFNNLWRGGGEDEKYCCGDLHLKRSPRGTRRPCACIVNSALSKPCVCRTYCDYYYYLQRSEIAIWIRLKLAEWTDLSHWIGAIKRHFVMSVP